MDLHRILSLAYIPSVVGRGGIDKQYARVFASMHCSPMAWSSAADRPWIRPSLSGRASAEVNVVGVDIVEGRREERGDALRCAMMRALSRGEPLEEQGKVMSVGGEVR